MYQVLFLEGLKEFFGEVTLLYKLIIYFGASFFKGREINIIHTSNEYKGLLKELQIRQSMDGKSRWADNIMIERWFRSLKTEEIYLNEYHSPRELRQALERYVTDYNSVRPHEAIGYKTPDEVFASCFRPAA